MRRLYYTYQKRYTSTISFTRVNAPSTTKGSNPILVSVLFTILFIGYSLSLFSQKNADHLRFSLGSGRQYFDYPLMPINEIKKNGLNASGEYDFFFDTNWAVTTGIGAQTYLSWSEINGIYEFNINNKGVLDNYTYKIKCSNLETMQSGWFISVPLALRFESKIRSFRTIYSKYLRYSISSGINVAFPINTDHAHSSGVITTYRYYPDTKTEVYNLPELGLDTFIAAPHGTLYLNTSYMLFAELSLMLAAEKRHEFYLSFYYSHGINNSIKSTETKVINNGGEQTTLIFSDLVQKAHLISYGIKLGISLSLAKKTRYLEANN